MKFGPEVDDALGGRLEGVTYQLPNHCAAILRALLLTRAPARLYFSTHAGEAGENEYTLQFLSAQGDAIDERLDALRQNGFVEEKDLTRTLSSRNIRMHFLRREPGMGLALIQDTNATARRKRLYQAIAFLPRLLPGLFAESPVSETELALLKAASEADCDTIEKILETLYKESELCGVRQKQQLHNVISHRLSAELRKARDEATAAEQRASAHLQQYINQSQAAMSQKILAEDLERRFEAMTEDVDEVLAFIGSNKAVAVNIEGSTMLLDVTGPLSNFDPDAYRVLRDKPFAHFRENILGSQEDALLFFDALFLEESIQVIFSARYAIEPCNGVKGRLCVVTPAAVPNPHIQYHQCLGQYRGDMQEALSRSDFVGVISLCVASGLSLNVPESATCGRFVQDVTGGSHKAVLLPDSEMVSYKAAVAWLKQQKGIEEEVEPNGETDPNGGNGD